MQLCWLRIDEFHKTCSLDVALGVDGGSGLANSLVMATPKHVVFITSDPTFLLMPRDPSSRYVFHDLVPARFQDMKESGHAVLQRDFTTWPRRKHSVGKRLVFRSKSPGKAGVVLPHTLERLSCSFPETKSFLARGPPAWHPYYAYGTYIVWAVC
jgi:hypothetical protein